MLKEMYCCEEPMDINIIKNNILKRNEKLTKLLVQKEEEIELLAKKAIRNDKT